MFEKRTDKYRVHFFIFCSTTIDNTEYDSKLWNIQNTRSMTLLWKEQCSCQRAIIVVVMSRHSRTTLRPCRVQHHLDYNCCRAALSTRCSLCGYHTDVKLAKCVSPVGNNTDWFINNGAKLKYIFSEKKSFNVQNKEF